jgi:hypothetical protein
MKYYQMLLSDAFNIFEDEFQSTKIKNLILTLLTIRLMVLVCIFQLYYQNSIIPKTLTVLSESFVNLPKHIASQ